MEQMLGRELHPWENIHHRDGNRACNDQSNLELWIKTQPSGIRLSDLVDKYQAELLAARRLMDLDGMAPIKHLPALHAGGADDGGGGNDPLPSPTCSRHGSCASPNERLVTATSHDAPGGE